MKMRETLRLVWLNISQNKFKTVMTSIGIVVGSATIVMVIAIGRGGQMDVAEEFSSLNAGAVDVSYDYAGTDSSGSGNSIGNFFMNMFGMGGNGGGPSGTGSSGGDQTGGGSSDSAASSSGDASSGGGSSAASMPSGGGPSGSSSSDSGSMPSAADGQMPGSPDSAAGTGGQNTQENVGANGQPGGESAENTEESTEDESSTEEDSIISERLNQDKITLTEDDVEDIELLVSGIDGATISYSTRSSVEGADLTEAQTLTIAGVKENYYSLSNLQMADGEFITEEDDDSCSRVCVIGSTLAEELFENTEDAVGSSIYIDDRTYTVIGILDSTQTVSAGISPDETIFIPYDTGIKYIVGSDADPVITVISSDVNAVSTVEENIEAVLEENYPNSEFTYEDAGSKMEAAEASNRTLTILLTAMAAIVFLVGGIGIMNVLFVSVRERTEEIGILKALGASHGTIMTEFLFESAATALIGGILGVGASFLVTPVIEHFGVRVEANVAAYVLALVFALLTGILFGIYPAWKASKLVPVDALNTD